MSGLEEEDFPDNTPPPENKRGRPLGKADSTQRTRRTAQEISDDKIRIAQVKLDARREAGERKLAAKTTKSRPQKTKAAGPKPIVQEIVMAKTSKAPRDDSASPSLIYYVSKKQALYDSFFAPQKRY